MYIYIYYIHIRKANENLATRPADRLRAGFYYYRRYTRVITATSVFAGDGGGSAGVDAGSLMHVCLSATSYFRGAFTVSISGLKSGKQVL